MTDALAQQVAAAILGEPRYTRAQVVAASGVPEERGVRLWRAMGFAEVSDGTVVFTDRDVEALRTAAALLDAGVVDEDGLVALTRSMAQALSRLAVSHAAIADEHLARTGVAPGDEPREVEDLVPRVAALMDFVWRRHLVVAAEDALVTMLGEARDDVPVAVGFADLVGFTETSRHASAADLAALVERFEAYAAERVGDGGGRVVKTLGDEVLFTAADAGAAAGIALALAEHADEVRVGVAYGPVLARLGDVFGPTVNIASRLTGLALPATVLVDREAATALRDDPRYDVAPIRRQAVRGYSHLAPYRLRRARTS
jgi:adenylate cyclase